MIVAFALALGQLGDRRILALLLRCAVETVVLVCALGWGLWWLAADAFTRLGVENWLGGGAGQVLAVLPALVAGWLLFMAVALAVTQFHADAVVETVEARHYPDRAACARPLGLAREAWLGLRGAGRALLLNLVALPVALLLVVTGIGPFLVFGFVNAVVLGRELTDLVRLRYEGSGSLLAADLPRGTRWLLGGACVALLAVPFVNLLALVIGAAAATHLVHRRANGQENELA